MRGKEYAYSGPSRGRLSNFKNELKGRGPFLNDDLQDRPVEVFEGSATPRSDPGRESCLLLPIIPPITPTWPSGRSIAQFEIRAIAVGGVLVELVAQGADAD